MEGIDEAEAAVTIAMIAEATIMADLSHE